MPRFFRYFQAAFIFILMVMIVACFKGPSGGSINAQSLPDISFFTTNPTDHFIISSNDYSKVSNAFPFKGNSTSCPHTGAHLHFTTTGAPYHVELYAPVDGIIESVEKCVDLGTVDRFGISLAFAQHNGQTLGFYFSIEPAQGKLCSAGDPDYYAQYIFVTVGQTVQKGDLLAYFPKLDTIDSGPHLHFHLGDLSGHYCPNIFNSTVMAEFGSLYGFETCNGQSLPNTFCYQPGTGEDLTGL